MNKKVLGTLKLRRKKILIAVDKKCISRKAKNKTEKKVEISFQRDDQYCSKEKVWNI